MSPVGPGHGEVGHGIAHSHQREVLTRISHHTGKLATGVPLLAQAVPTVTHAARHSGTQTAFFSALDTACGPWSMIRAVGQRVGGISDFSELIFPPTADARNGAEHSQIE